MTSEPRINHNLLLVFGLRKLDEEDLRREVVNVRYSESHERICKLVGDDLVSISNILNIHRGQRLTLTSKEENLCFIALF